MKIYITSQTMDHLAPAANEQCVRTVIWILHQFWRAHVITHSPSYTILCLLLRKFYYQFIQVHSGNSVFW